MTELLEDRTLLAAGFRVALPAPRLSGGNPGPSQVRVAEQSQISQAGPSETSQAGPSLVIQADTGQNLEVSGGLGSGVAHGGPGYPPPTTAAGVQANLAVAAQPDLLLIPAAPTFAGSLTPMLTTSVAPQVAANTSVVPLASLFPGAASASIATAPTATASLTAATSPGATTLALASTGVTPSGTSFIQAPASFSPATAPTTSIFRAPAFADAGTTIVLATPGQPASGTLLAHAGTGNASAGIRADSYTNLSVFLPPAAIREGLLPVSAAPGRTTLPGDTAAEVRQQKEALLTAWEMGTVSATVPEATPPVVQGRLVVAEDRVEALSGLVPVDRVFAQAVVPGTPDLADSLTNLESSGGGAAHGSTASPRLDVVVLGSLLAFGCWGLGQFRDALTAYAETNTPPALRNEDEEEDE
jgi:hypothetical protein